MARNLEVHPTAALAAEAGARRFVAAASEAIGPRGAFMVALSGGSTPRGLYEQLATERLASLVDWRRVQVFWGDERCVPPDGEASNYRMAREALLDRVPIPAVNVHRIRGEYAPNEAAAAYERVVRGALRTPVGPPGTVGGTRFDLVLLGLGTDGHTASLFPGPTPVQNSTSWVEAGYHQADAMWRVTLTPTLLNAAAEVMFLVTGSEKADVLRDVLQGPYRPSRLPAQLIAPTAGRVRWFVDACAATSFRETLHDD